MIEQRTLTRLMSVSYCRAEPDVAVTTPARRKMPCSSRSFLMLRTWESRVCRSRSWRYFSLEPQINSNSFLTCLLTNGVCWIIRYWGENEEKINVFLPFVQTQVEKKNQTSDTLNRLPQIDSRTRNGQRQEVGYVGWCQRSFWSDTAAGAPFQSIAGSRLQTHQQHVPNRKSITVTIQYNTIQHNTMQYMFTFLI